MIIVTGHAKMKPGALAALRPAMEAMILASRAEEGCLGYSYGVDTLDEDRMLVLEYWRDMAALEAHFAAPHMADWRAALAGHVVELDVKAGDASTMKPLG
ncbi:MAG: antibiotic biosynthesis monooxygenase [Alphaproteobacteria bacterium]|nr:antibiotic biosynthesis monooxygenase [Alphaproteobacteria bacterium]